MPKGGRHPHSGGGLYSASLYRFTTPDQGIMMYWQQSPESPHHLSETTIGWPLATTKHACALAEFDIAEGQSSAWDFTWTNARLIGSIAHEPCLSLGQTNHSSGGRRRLHPRPGLRGRVWRPRREFRCVWFQALRSSAR